MYFCSIILARTQHSGMHFGWPARMTAHTSWVSDAYPLVLMCLWWMRVVTCCSQWPREWHLVQGSEVMRELNLKSETSRLSGTTSSASQGVAEDHLGFL